MPSPLKTILQENYKKKNPRNHPKKRKKKKKSGKMAIQMQCGKGSVVVPAVETLENLRTRV
jgi:hypothetical protein